MAGKLNLMIPKGETFRRTLVYKDSSKNIIDLTGYTARMQIRERYSSPDFIVELTTENGGITITEAAGQIDLLITDASTSAIAEKDGVYDLEIIDSSDTSDVTKIVRGTVTFLEEVTK